MKNCLPLTALACCLLGPAAHAQSVHPQRSGEGNKSSVATIKHFYRYYILEENKTFPYIKLNNDTLRKYCTASFLKKWHDEREYDMILQAQDDYVEWAKNNRVTPLNNTKNNGYKVCFQGPLNHCIIVTIKQEQGRYKISDTKMLN